MLVYIYDLITAGIKYYKEIHSVEETSYIHLPK
jgi:hypothetical protein